MPKLDETLRIASALGFYYENESTVERLTEKVSTQIDISACLRDDPKQFRTLDTVNNTVKKTLLLSAWNVDWLETDLRIELVIFLTRLMAHGFVCQISCQQGLVETSNAESLNRALLDYKPISRTDARCLAACEGIASDNLELLTAERIQAILIHLECVSPAEAFPFLPTEMCCEEIDELADLLEPEDALSVLVDFNKVTLDLDYYEPLKIRPFIRELRIDNIGRLNDENPIALMHSVESLIMSDSYIETNWFANVLLNSCIRKLTLYKTSFVCSTDFPEQVDLPLLARALSVLTELRVTRYDDSYNSLHIFHEALMRQPLPNLRVLELKRLPEKNPLQEADTHLLEFKPDCPNLEKLAIHVPYPIQGLLYQAQALTSLEIAGKCCTSLTPDLMMHLDQVNTLSILNDVSAEFFEQIIRGTAFPSCRSLTVRPQKTISIDWSSMDLTGVRNRTINSLCLERIWINGFLLQYFDNLIKLNLTRCCFPVETDTRVLKQTFQSLEHLRLVSEKSYESSLDTILANAPLLTKTTYGMGSRSFLTLALREWHEILSYEHSEQWMHLSTGARSVLAVKMTSSSIDDAPMIPEDRQLMSLNIQTICAFEETSSTPDLQKLCLNGISLTRQTFVTMLNRYPCLRELVITNATFEGESVIAASYQHPLCSLTIESSSGLQASDLSVLLSNLPGLRHLAIRGFDFKSGSAQPVSGTSGHRQLRTLDLSDSTFTLRQLDKIIESAPKLMRITLKQCPLTVNDIFFLQAKYPSIHLDFGYRLSVLSMPAQAMEEFPGDRVYIRTKKSLHLYVPIQGAFGAYFRHIKLPYSLIEVSPPFTRARTFPIPATKVSTFAAISSRFNEFTAFKDQALSQATSSLTASKGTRRTNSVFAESLSLDGNFLNDPTTTTRPRELFKDITPLQYHLQAYTWESGEFVRFEPSEDDLIDVDVERLDPQVLHQRPRSSGRKYSHRQFSAATFEWMMLPATSTEDQLLAFGSLQPIRPKKHAFLGYHYIRVERKMAREFVCNFEIVPGKPSPHTVVPEARDLVPLIGQLRFGEEGLLENDALQQLGDYSVGAVVDALFLFCSFSEESQANMEGLPHELLNHLIRTRAGACRHRARLFVAIASELGIPALMIQNESHEFVVVKRGGARPLCLDLGGAEVQVKPIAYEDNLPVALQALAVAPARCAPSKRMRRRTGRKNNFPLSGQNPSQIIQAIISRASTRKTQLLVTPDADSVEALHEAMLGVQTSPCFFSLNPEDISLQMPFVTAGAPVASIASELAHFIQAAGSEPDRSFIWFINWSTIKGSHIRMINALTDSRDPMLDGQLLPDNLRVVLIMPQYALASVGEDLYSRMASSSQCPRLLPPPRPLETLKVLEPGEALIISPTDWQDVLLMHFQMEAFGLRANPGALIRSLAQGDGTLTLHNAPWAIEAFRYRYREWVSRKPFLVNGEWYQLPEGFNLILAQPLLTLSLTALQREAIPGPVFDYVINACNWREFIANPGYVRAEGGVGERPALMAEAQAHTICLWVTGNLSREVWYQLLASPEVQSAALRVVRVGEVILPEELNAFAAHHPTLPTSPLVRAVLANDIDYAESCLVGDAQQAVRRYSPGVQTVDTSFLFHVWRRDGVLYGAETDLLQALKRGEPLNLKGRFSPVLMQHLQSLFMSQPYLMINGERVTIRSQLTFISDDEAAFRHLSFERIHYDSQVDMERLVPALGEQLSNVYQSLQITPCHSHFFDLPEGRAAQAMFMERLIQRLYLSAGLPGPDNRPVSSSSCNGIQPTTAQDIVMALAEQRLLVLVSDTGEGKSHLMEEELTKADPDITIYYGREQRMQWALSTAKKPLVFFDEANTTEDDYSFLESLARGEKFACIDGHDVVLKQHSAVLAINPDTYKGRKSLDLLRRFPIYRPFIGVDIASILNPFQSLFERDDSLSIIGHYYRLAKQQGLPVTPRNALMICASAFAIKSMHYRGSEAGEKMAVYAAVYYGLKSAGFEHKQIRHALREGVVEDAGYKPQLPLTELNSAPDRFVWTNPRQKLLAPLLVFLEIRRYKQEGVLPQGMGQNAFLLEGESGYVKTSFLREALAALELTDATVRTDSILHMREDLLRAWDNGELVLMDEFSSFPDIPWLLKLLANAHPETGRPPNKAGFALLVTQNPITYGKREQLCKAMFNRMVTLRPRAMRPEEFREILEKGATLPLAWIEKVVADYSKAFADEGPQNPRDWFMTANEQPEPLELNELENYFDSLLDEIKTRQWKLGYCLFFFTGLGGRRVVIDRESKVLPGEVERIVSAIQNFKVNKIKTLESAQETHQQIKQIARSALANKKHSRALETTRFYQRASDISDVSLINPHCGPASTSV